MKLFMAGLVLVIVPQVAHAAISDYASTENELHCIQSLGLNENQLKSGFYKYQIERCVDLRVSTMGHEAELKRLALRQQRILERVNRNSRRLDLTGHKHAVIRVRGGRVYEDVDFSVEPVRRSPRRAVPESLTPAELGQRRRQKAQAARTACQGAERSFYQNCVRDEMRQTGLGVSRYIGTSVIQQRRSATGGRTRTPLERKQAQTQSFVERSATARRNCQAVAKSFYQNCVREEMRRLGGG